jgi:hypothetical protein
MYMYGKKQLKHAIDAEIYFSFLFSNKTRICAFLIDARDEINFKWKCFVFMLRNVWAWEIELATELENLIFFSIVNI